MHRYNLYQYLTLKCEQIRNFQHFSIFPLFYEMSVRVVGEVDVHKCLLRWILPQFNVLPEEENIRIWSKKFHLANALVSDFYDFNPIPKHISGRNDVPTGCLGLAVESKMKAGNQHRILLVGIIDERKNVISNCKTQGGYDLHGNYYFKVDDLCKKTSLKVDSIYQLFCQIFNEEFNSLKNVSVKEGVACGENAVKEITQPELNNRTDEEINSQHVRNLEKLGEDLKELYITGQDADITIKVKDKEFKAHKVILRVRSSVFNAMFTHELSENKSNTIPIQDCDPDIFEQFLYFIYSGRIRNLTSENACELYYIADKYLLPELKQECIMFFKNNMSIETICDIVYLSVKYKEAELLKLAELFFAKHMEEILVTVKWQLFMKENPTEANEITLKALRLGFTKKEI